MNEVLTGLTLAELRRLETEIKAQIARRLEALSREALAVPVVSFHYSGNFEAHATGPLLNEVRFVGPRRAYKRTRTDGTPNKTNHPRGTYGKDTQEDT